MKNAIAILLMLSALARAVPPTISSAMVSGSTISISGANFGSKGVAAPFKFQPFTATSQGQTYAQVGFDFVAGNNHDDTNNYVDMGDGVGGGSWLHKTPLPISESFSHFGHYLPAVNEVFASYWVRIHQLTTPIAPGLVTQFKGIRAGSRTGTNPTEEMYYRGPKYYWSTYCDVQNMNDLTAPNCYIDNAAGLKSFYYPETYNVPFYNNTWHYVEAYYRFNDVGIANGIMQVRLDGTQHADLSNQEPRELSSEFIDYIQYSPGVSGDFDKAEWEVRFSRIYTDTTRARVFLGNAATLAACTGRFLLSPSAWGNTDVTAGAASNIPVGYSWVYVANSGGEINVNGYAYTVANPAVRRVFFLR